MDNANNNLLLINGMYSLDEAKEILVALLDDKVKFHNNKIFSHEERYGEQHEHSVERIKALKETKEKILKLIESTDSNKKIKLHSTVNIEIQ